MKKQTIIKSSVFNASKDEVFRRLQKLETWQYIATPFAQFVPLGDEQSIKWREGETFSFKLFLFYKIPFGIHTIRVISFDKNLGVSTHEHNKHIPIWNHKIHLETIDDDTTRYTDEIEIGAGWKTPFVALWARAFYAHRQRRWQKLLLKKSN